MRLHRREVYVSVTRVPRRSNTVTLGATVPASSTTPYEQYALVQSSAEACQSSLADKLEVRRYIQTATLAWDFLSLGQQRTARFWNLPRSRGLPALWRNRTPFPPARMCYN